MKHLPCKTDKCILFPLCIGQRVIDCNELIEWYEYYKKELPCQKSVDWYRAVKQTMKALQGATFPCEVKLDGFETLYFLGIPNIAFFYTELDRV